MRLAIITIIAMSTMALISGCACLNKDLAPGWSMIKAEAWSTGQGG